MTGSRQEGLRRWLAAVLAVAMLVAGVASPADAFSYDPRKIDPSLLTRALAAPAVTFDVIVRAKAVPTAGILGSSADRAGKAALRAGGLAKFPLGIVGGAAATLTGAQILQLSKDGDIDVIVRDEKVHLKWDPAAAASAAATPGVVAVGAPQAWRDLGVSGQGVGVAVVDSGVYAQHPDLAGRVTARADFTGMTATGDPGGHGTHVAALVAGDGTASGGRYTGVAPRANIIDVRVIDANGTSNTSIILRGLQWVLNNRVAHNIKVANLSFGATVTQSYKTDLMGTAAEVLTFAGITVVVSAGNGGTAETITSPANNPYVVTVGALDDNETASTSDDLMATFSSRGRTAIDGVAKPDLVAPGRKLVSALSPGSTLATQFPDRLVTAPGASQPEYFRLSGTSMSAPIVAGVAALMYERNATLSPAVVKQRLRSNATSLSFGTSLDRGAGMVNAAKAVAAVSTTKAYSSDRVTDAFAKDMRKFIQGQPFSWKSLSYNGGVDKNNVSWENVSWENVSWENVTWENVSWENFSWENVSWESVSWENVSWETSESQTTSALAGSGSGWQLVD